MIKKTILLIEDELPDVELMETVLKKNSHHIQLINCKNGEEALHFLEKRLISSQPLPDLILSDIRMKKMTGFELLEKVKSNSQLQQIPFIILTNSDTEQDILMAYKFHANCYLKKPSRLSELADLMRSIEEFWLVLPEPLRK